MSAQSQAKKNAIVSQFRAVTGASQTDSVKYMKKHDYRLDIAIDAYFESAASRTTASSTASSTHAITELFEKYQDSPDSIGANGTMKLCEDLGIDPEDVVTLALAYELKSPTIGDWPKKGWIEGMKALKCDSLASLKAATGRLRSKLGSDVTYFGKVYAFAFTFGLSPGQRSLPIDVAVPFWNLLIPFGLSEGALAHVDDLNSDPPVSTYPGWKPEYTQMWFEYLEGKNVKGVSKDTWNMFIDFVRTIDEKFQRHDTEGSWPSLIDDFVDYAKEKVAAS